MSKIFAGRNFRESLDLGLFAFLFSRMATCMFIGFCLALQERLCVLNGDGTQGAIVL